MGIPSAAVRRTRSSGLRLSGIALYFDEGATARIDAIAAELGGHRTEGSSRRHLTLASLEGENATALERVARDVAERTPAFTLAFPAVGSFAGPDGVVFLAPALSSQLLAAHAAVHRALATHGLEGDLFTRPGAWVPHCTLATGLEEPQVATALDAARSAGPVDRVDAVGVGVVTRSPPRPRRPSSARARPRRRRRCRAS